MLQIQQQQQQQQQRALQALLLQFLIRRAILLFVHHPYDCKKGEVFPEKEIIETENKQRARKGKETKQNRPKKMNKQTNKHVHYYLMYSININISKNKLAT